MGLMSLLGFGNRKKQVLEVLENGAMIVDVRTTGECMGGKLNNSVNIPLGELPARLPELKADGKPIVFCCASGMRSGMAASKAKAVGIEAYNGGGWMQLNGWLENG